MRGSTALQLHQNRDLTHRALPGKQLRIVQPLSRVVLLSDCEDLEVLLRLVSYDSIALTIIVTMQEHLAPEMRVLIFSGDVDACVPYLGTMRWVADVAENKEGPAWPVVGDSWRSWLVDENVAGYFTAYAVNAEKNFVRDPFSS